MFRLERLLVLDQSNEHLGMGPLLSSCYYKGIYSSKCFIVVYLKLKCSDQHSDLIRFSDWQLHDIVECALEQW